MAGFEFYPPPPVMRLLVIEDEPKLADYLHRGLSENGYVVDLARDGIDGRRLATGGDYDLVLAAGEAAEFDTRLPHWFGSADDAPVEVLSLFGPQGERLHFRAQPRRGSNPA